MTQDKDSNAAEGTPCTQLSNRLEDYPCLQWPSPSQIDDELEHIKATYHCQQFRTVWDSFNRAVGKLHSAQHMLAQDYPEDAEYIRKDSEDLATAERFTLKRGAQLGWVNFELTYTSATNPDNVIRTDLFHDPMRMVTEEEGFNQEDCDFDLALRAVNRQYDENYQEQQSLIDQWVATFPFKVGEHVTLDGKPSVITEISPIRNMHDGDTLTIHVFGAEKRGQYGHPLTPQPHTMSWWRRHLKPADTKQTI